MLKGDSDAEYGNRLCDLIDYNIQIICGGDGDDDDCDDGDAGDADDDNGDRGDYDADDISYIDNVYDGGDGEW